jgi:Tol biopolymer transport system component
VRRYGRLATRSQLLDARRLALAALLCSLAAIAGSARGFARAEAWGSKEPTFVVYSRHQTGTENHDVYFANADGSHEVRLSSWRGDEQTPQFSPDGKTIVFRAARDPGDAPEIWVMNRDGSKKRNLTRTPKQTEWSPTWTPNGRHIVFSCGGADPNGVGDDLCSMDADGSHRRYLLKNPDGSEEYRASTQQVPGSPTSTTTIAASFRSGRPRRMDVTDVI